MKSVIAGALALAAILGVHTAGATTISDPAGDFLPTFTGPQNGDLDALSVTAKIEGSDFFLSTTVNGAIGTTPNAVYVFGVNTGSGLPLFSPFETKVLFDSVVVLNPAGGSIVADNLLGATTVTPIAATVSGDTISALVPIALLPSTGLTPGEFGFSLWPRLNGGPFSNIADFAPNNGTFAAVPEPASWGLMIVGFGAMGAVARKRRRALAEAA